jgi:hypothetical protein
MWSGEIARKQWRGPIWLALALMASGLVNCEPTPPCQVDSELGSCCQTEADCNADLACLDQFPGGLCSLNCAEDHLCPAGGRCIHIVSQSRGDLGRACLRLCGDGLPACRPDYSCAQTSDPQVRICFPA